jgi:2-polyprenyl-3-methyl-5-hydroxy-6-metoxy-1,4-benzoquinol methylase
MNQEHLQDLMEKMVNELGAAANGALVALGDRLGLYRGLAEGPTDAAGLAERTGTTQRYVQEWLSAQAASGFVSYDNEAGTFSLSPEQRAVFADEDGPFLLTGGFYSVSAIYRSQDKLAEAFRSGSGLGWEEHHEDLFCGTEKFFRSSYRGHLLGEWLPALDGVVDKLDAGAKIADVGCGHGASTLLMAEAFPRSTFVGYDFHEASVASARTRAESQGLKNVTFETASAKTFPGRDHDLVTMFDCLHDMGDPQGAAAHIRQALRPDGTLMVVEPFAHDDLEQNLNPVGRVYYAFSTTVCTPASLKQEVRAGLGAQAGEARLRQVITDGGFTRFRRATETPFNLILEAQP